MDSESSITHTESDICLRLVEVWFDSTWAYYMSSSTEQFYKRMDKHRRAYSSTASVAGSSVADGSIMGKSLQDKLYAIQKSLKVVEKKLGLDEFSELCAVCLKSCDQLYPGFRDILLIARYLLRESDTYRGKLTNAQIDSITLPMLYQHIYYEMSDFLLRTSKGSEALKLLTHPTKITHATYDICRQKFCRLLCDESGIVEYGILRLVHIMGDDPSSAVEPEAVEEEEEAPEAPEAPKPVEEEEEAPEAPKAVEEEEAPEAPEAVEEPKAKKTKTTRRSAADESYSSVPYYSAYGSGKLKSENGSRRLFFPLTKYSYKGESSSEEDD